MDDLLKLAIAEPSDIVRNGLVILLKRLPGIHLSLIEIRDMEHLFDNLKSHRPDILIINPALLGCFSIARIKEECDCGQMKCIALLYSASDQVLIKPYDEVVNIYDEEDQIRHKLSHCFVSVEEAQESECNDEQQCLSSREKEIVVCVVKGMTNKEIAEKLYLSAHTVITHRRNIAKKLQIHSASGLTIYAIVNKLVELEEIKDI